jgi:hypothetical protein
MSYNYVLFHIAYVYFILKSFASIDSVFRSWTMLSHQVMLKTCSINIHENIVNIYSVLQAEHKAALRLSNDSAKLGRCWAIAEQQSRENPKRHKCINRGTVFSVQFVPRCYKQEMLARSKSVGE